MTSQSQQTLERLESLNLFRPEQTVDRDILDYSFSSFLCSDRRVMVFEGPPGSGKTTWLCRMAEKRLASGQPILFETAGKLAGYILPDCVAQLLRVGGDFAGALDRIDNSSSERAVIALDDIGTTENPAALLCSLFDWVEKLQERSPVKIAVAVSSEKWTAFVRMRGNSVPARYLTHVEIPTFASVELLALADKIAIPMDHDRKQTLSGRREIVEKLVQTANRSVTRPSLAAVILELYSTVESPLGFSAVRVYEELFRRQVLGSEGSSPAKYPLRGRIVMRIADLMLKGPAQRLTIDSDEVLGLRLIDPSSGRRSEDYDALLAEGVLVESLEDFTTHVSFADPRFFEYVASCSLDVERFSENLRRLLKELGSYQSMRRITSFYVSRALKTLGSNSCWRSIGEEVQDTTALFVDLGLIDGDSFLVLFEHMSCERPKEAEAVGAELMRLGESGLVSQAGAILLRVAADSESADRARLLRARALYEIDEYADSTNELSKIAGRLKLEAAMLQAEISVAKGGYHEARRTYESLLSEVTPDHFLSLRLQAGLAFVLGRLGQHERAKTMFYECVQGLERYPQNQVFPEALGDLGQLLASRGDTIEGRRCIEASLNANERNGFLVGVGVAEGLLGEVDILEGRLPEAKSRLEKALHISRLARNRWRESWILQKLGDQHAASGELEKSRIYYSEAGRIRAEIGARE